MKKSRLLLLDADVVIQLFKLGIWERVIEVYDVHLARIVAEDEAHFYIDDEGLRQHYDLTPYIEAGRITVFDVAPSGMVTFLGLFGPLFLEKLDPGEAESLAYLLDAQEECQICSADKIVYRVLGALHRREDGISLEELLQKSGLGRRLPRHFGKDYREEWTRKGFIQGMHGLGLKDPD